MNRSRWIPGMLALGGLVLCASAAVAGLPPAPGDSTGVIPDSTRYAGLHWGTVPELPCDGNEVAIAVDFCTCNVELLSDGGSDGLVNLHVRINDHVCVQCAPDTVFFPLGTLTAGYYMVDVVITAEFVHGDSTVAVETTHHPFNFAVSRTCPGSPPPGVLPYVSWIQIGLPMRCVGCPPIACPDDSIPVLIHGEFPDNCITLDRVELLPSMAVGPAPVPPVLRIVYATNSCLERPCVQAPFPWDASVKLPPLPPGSYYLPAETAEFDACTDSIPEVTANVTLPFQVIDSCGVPPSPDCFVTRFEGEGPGTGCTAFVGPGTPAELTLDIASGVALAGLQGKLAFYPAGLAVTGLEAVGPAAGMHLAWKATDQGASFFMFADQGAPIPDTDRLSFAPVLRATVSAIAGVPIPDRTRLYTLELLGSDAAGGAVNECPGILESPAVLAGAVICAGSPCDLNGDGTADVRDLVVMVHCILGAGECPAGKSVDCNRDGANTIDDVLCCAHVMLGGDLGPDTTGGRVEPAVTVRLREPVRTATGMDLPLTLAGADRVGAARLELVFPTGRYDVAGVDLTGDGTGWLNLHETNADHLVIGLIGLPGTVAAGGSAVDLVVHFALKPGQSAGGDVTLAGTQFSGPDGVALKTAIGQPSRPLGPPARVALTASRPNPFSSQTRFSVDLAAAGDLDVSVYDLQGRLVTNLYRGHAEAGSVDLVWKRTRSDGTAVPSGIYFYRAVAGSASATSKVVVMSRE